MSALPLPVGSDGWRSGVGDTGVAYTNENDVPERLRHVGSLITVN